MSGRGRKIYTTSQATREGDKHRQGKGIRLLVVPDSFSRQLLPSILSFATAKFRSSLSRSPALISRGHETGRQKTPVKRNSIKVQRSVTSS